MNTETERSPLEWPKTQVRTRQKEQQGKRIAAAKKPWKHYVELLGSELKKIGAKRYVVTFNDANSPQGRDAGVAVWFDRQKADDFKWQDVLAIDNPWPTSDEIEKAFRVKVVPLHPDRHINDPTFDPEPYHQLVKARKEALDFIKGSSELPRGFVIPCDAYEDRTHNLYAILRTIKAMRDIERFGAGQLFEGALHGFAGALPEKASETIHV